MRASRKGAAIGSAAALVLALLALGGNGVAMPAKGVVDNLEAEFGISYVPHALPKKKPAPIASSIWGKVRTLDGANPSALRELRLMGDKSVELNLGDRPSCHLPGRERLTPDDFRRLCRASVVGTGSIDGIVVYAGDIPLDIKSELVAVKGDQSTIYAYAYFQAPITAAVYIPIEVRKVRRGRFGTETIVSIPKLANGGGAVTHFELILKKGVLRASCSDRQLDARLTVAFESGAATALDLGRPCTPKISRRTRD